MVVLSQFGRSRSSSEHLHSLRTPSDDDTLIDDTPTRPTRRSSVDAPAQLCTPSVLTATHTEYTPSVFPPSVSLVSRQVLNQSKLNFGDSAPQITPTKVSFDESVKALPEDTSTLSPVKHQIGATKSPASSINGVRVNTSPKISSFQSQGAHHTPPQRHPTFPPGSPYISSPTPSPSYNLGCVNSPPPKKIRRPRSAQRVQNRRPRSAPDKDRKPKFVRMSTLQLPHNAVDPACSKNSHSPPADMKVSLEALDPPSTATRRGKATSPPTRQCRKSTPRPPIPVTKPLDGVSPLHEEIAPKSRSKPRRSAANNQNQMSSQLFLDPLRLHGSCGAAGNSINSCGSDTRLVSHAPLQSVTNVAYTNFQGHHSPYRKTKTAKSRSKRRKSAAKIEESDANQISSQCFPDTMMSPGNPVYSTYPLNSSSVDKMVPHVSVVQSFPHVASTNFQRQQHSARASSCDMYHLDSLGTGTNNEIASYGSFQTSEKQQLMSPAPEQFSRHTSCVAPSLTSHLRSVYDSPVPRAQLAHLSDAVRTRETSENTPLVSHTAQTQYFGSIEPDPPLAILAEAPDARANRTRSKDVTSFQAGSDTPVCKTVSCNSAVPESLIFALFNAIKDISYIVQSQTFEVIVPDPPIAVLDPKWKVPT